MAEPDRGGVGFVEGEDFRQLEEGTDGFGDLDLGGAAETDDGLFDAKGRVFEHGDASQRDGGDDGSAGRAEDLGSLVVLDVNGLLEGGVADGVGLQLAGDRAGNGGQAIGHGEGGGEAEGFAVEEAKAVGGGAFEEGETGAAEAGVDSQDEAAKGLALEEMVGVREGWGGACGGGGESFAGGGGGGGALEMFSPEGARVFT